MSHFQPNVGLGYDLATERLVRAPGDQLSTYRARKGWSVILASYFLLEPVRDYEMTISHDAEAGVFTLSVVFTSACGRYAYWRLFNQQAPEAAEKLRRAGVPSTNLQNPLALSC
jgi:predicted dithiol-disulfide oxidoreductase (DUF899 family)